jgi:hypothetical protein
VAERFAEFLKTKLFPFERVVSSKQTDQVCEEQAQFAG